MKNKKNNKRTIAFDQSFLTMNKKLKKETWIAIILIVGLLLSALRIGVAYLYDQHLIKIYNIDYGSVIEEFDSIEDLVDQYGEKYELGEIEEHINDIDQGIMDYSEKYDLVCTVEFDHQKGEILAYQLTYQLIDQYERDCYLYYSGEDNAFVLEVNDLESPFETILDENLITTILHNIYHVDLDYIELLKTVRQDENHEYIYYEEQGVIIDFSLQEECMKMNIYK